MTACSILLIDLRVDNVDSGLADLLASRYSLKRIKSCKEIDASITKHYPGILCFDYDTPTTSGLAALQATKCSYPTLPIIMLTENHSESLALWALRARVWDYFIKPVYMEELGPSLRILATMSRDHEIPRQPYFPEPRAAQTYVDRNNFGPYAKTKRTQPSMQYMEEHYARRIKLNDVAEICHLSPSAFSHLFRKEQGITFSEFLLRYRVLRASELLVHSTQQVSIIANSVGFNDVSYFSRTFRRIMGVSPSHYRSQS